MTEEHVIIIGNGISGITLARHIRKQSKKKMEDGKDAVVCSTA
jgi:cation diffusion facilitator CzcD-associated flavoprotein CzcO